MDGYNVIAAVDGEAHNTMTDTFTIDSGVPKYVNILVYYDNYKSLTSGTTMNIKIYSAGGID